MYRYINPLRNLEGTLFTSDHTCIFGTGSKMNNRHVVVA